MNLLEDAWLPFMFADGTEATLPLAAIANPDIINFALPRADFQSAAYQFAIGLLQTCFAPEDDIDWSDRYNSAPAEAELTAVFQRVSHAFNTIGTGPLFMQDLDLLADQTPVNVSSLLIDAPGANGIKQNTDHFIKRGVADTLSLPMAVLALFTLQINAPSGGAGHRVGLRGGGPLTTIIVPDQKNTPLWQTLWLNVMSETFLGSEWQVDENDLNSGRIFPWLAPTKDSSQKDTSIYHVDTHPLHMYWAMPRRIRLTVDDRPGDCQISGLPATQTVSTYRTQNYGNNYEGAWAHPLTAYTWNPKKPEKIPLSVKGQPNGVNYKIWDVLSLSSEAEGQHCAAVINHYCSISNEAGLACNPQIWVSGYDMDNMKARGWYAVSLPLFRIDRQVQATVIVNIKRFQSLAKNMVEQLRLQFKAAWFERPKDVKGDLSFIDVAFWSETQSAFFKLVSQQVSQSTTGQLLKPDDVQTWLTVLQQTVLGIFDKYALADSGNQRTMARRIKARQALSIWVFNHKSVKMFKKDYQIEKQQEAVCP